MNKLPLLPLLFVVAACGRGFPVDREPLSPCNGLDRATCGQRTDCSVQDLACAAVCLDDGHGGCQPCDSFRCIPAAPVACESLPVTACGTRSDCQLETAACTTVCARDSLTPCAPCQQQERCVTARPPACSSLDVTVCQTRPDCAVETNVGGDAAPCFCDPTSGPSCTCNRPLPQPHCVDAPPPACESLSVAQCGGRADCHVNEAVCDCVNCGCDVPTCVSGPAFCGQLDINACSTRRDCQWVFSGFGGGGAPPCTGPNCQQPAPPPDQGVCVPAATECWQLDVNSCVSRADCALREVTACPACAPGETCPPCSTTLVCDVATVGQTCEQLDENACSLNPACQLEEITACPACVPGSSCPPCQSQFLCVTKPIVDSCSGLDIVNCSSRTDCRVEEVGVCPACVPGSMCPPCSTTFVCVAAPPTSHCFGLDANACSADPACVLEAWACTADCRDDGDGGCLPCEVPPPSCRPADPTTGVDGGSPRGP